MDSFSDHEHALIDNFLRPKIEDRPFHSDASFIHDADVCAMPPDELVRMYAPAPVPAGDPPHWYFISPAHYKGKSERRLRTLDNAIWGKQSMEYKVKVEGSSDVKCKRYFEYWDYDDASDTSDPQWMMVEYGIAQQGVRQQKLVLCMLYRSRDLSPS